MFSNVGSRIGLSGERFQQGPYAKLHKIMPKNLLYAEVYCAISFNKQQIDQLNFYKLCVHAKKGQRVNDEACTCSLRINNSVCFFLFFPFNGDLSRLQISEMNDPLNVKKT